MDLNADYELPFSARRVWAQLSDFGDLSWIPRGAEQIDHHHGRGAAATHHVHSSFSDTPSTHRLECIDSAAMSLSYSLHQTFMPVPDHTLSCEISPLTPGSSRLHINVHFNDDSVASAHNQQLMMSAWISHTVKQLNDYLTSAPKR